MSRSISSTLKAALLTHCKAHGLRKAAARRLAEAGCTLHEIAAVTGHKTLSEIERYTRAASQEALNASAIEKQAANKQVAIGRRSRELCHEQGPQALKTFF